MQYCVVLHRYEGPEEGDLALEPGECKHCLNPRCSRYPHEEEGRRIERKKEKIITLDGREGLLFLPALIDALIDESSLQSHNLPFLHPHTSRIASHDHTSCI